MTGLLRSFRHRQLTDLSRVRIIKMIHKSYQYVGGLKFFLHVYRRSFSGKISPRVDCYRIQADSSWWPLRMRAPCYHVGTQALNILGVSYAIRNEDNQVESSKIHSKENKFPIHVHTTHPNCSSTSLRKIFWNCCYSRSSQTSGQTILSKISVIRRIKSFTLLII